MKQYIISLNENELNQILDDLGEIYQFRWNSEHCHADNCLSEGLKILNSKIIEFEHGEQIIVEKLISNTTKQIHQAKFIRYSDFDGMCQISINGIIENINISQIKKV